MCIRDSYRAYLETLLNYSREEGATKLAPLGWVNQLNVIEEMGANSGVPVTADWSGNAELRALTSRLLSKNWHTFIIRPHLPPLKTGKLLVPNVQMDFELFLNPNSVYLMATPNKGTLTDKKFPGTHSEDITVTLLMRKVTLNASVYVRLQKERQLAGQTDCPLPCRAERNPHVFLRWTNHPVGTRRCVCGSIS